MLSSVDQAFVGRDEKRAPLKTPAWEAITRRTISLKLTYFTCGNATHNNAARDKVNLDFLHIIYLLEIIIAADPETK